ncbi:efflux RND transporter permease subunit [Agrobacterium rubi]|uniref:efflux RND transporter permease subunit n=1 Tax=Agrobacterium rubi TaxID=28099 RepID=UPI001573FD99|nr:efflux RND transporter permease subunit [Agrobacterium rubi]NTF10526.1 efflux RND transporter permease subunit [Agrobacterium rubi]NTF22920.1 efflux RND transporter permease subunit [Agrobacterium rubi]NTF29851.1 efflux RND transporter permease subunit [Agrobacterium rubi]
MNSAHARNATASFFIARPVFAIVLAIATMLSGGLGIYSLSISQYPDIAPVTVRVSATYTGATAEAVENSVTKKIESGMTGLDGLLYMESTSSTGSASISLTFSNGTDPELAQVEVQNKLARIESQLPDAVQEQGVQVNRSPSGILMIGNIVSRDSRYTSDQLSDIMSSQIEERIERLDGVGSVQSFGSGYAMRIWLDPAAMQKFQLVPSDVTTAITGQNIQVAAGSIGAAPVVKGQQLKASIIARTQMTTVDQFKRILLKTASDGSVVRLEDVGRVEVGLESYGQSSTFNGMPAAGFGVQLASGANAITTADLVHAELDNLAGSLPEGVEIAYSYETTPFVELSIKTVVETLIEAIILVFFVLLLFLQNLRATLIPMIAVPVVLAGTFAMLAALGYSINMLTMFAMVLAIGLLVDDAIVVVENVERIMRDEQISAREATEKSMGEITGALIGIALVLTAVFVPMAFFSGSVGVIYRQFSVTIASAMILSVLVAIVLTPALCAMLLKPSHDGLLSRWLGWFDRGFDRMADQYSTAVHKLVLRQLRMFAVFAALLVAAYGLYTKLPTSFFPEEDQGVLMTQITLPDGANAARTQAVIDIVQNYYLTQEKDAVQSVFMTLGFGFGGSGENAAMGFVRLKDFSDRTDSRQTASAVAQRASAYFRKIRDAEVFVLAPPAIQGLGQTDGFSMYLEDTGNQGRTALIAASNTLADDATGNAIISNLRGNTRTLEAQLRIDIDQEKATALGVDLADINSLITTVFSGTDVNDFIYNGEIKPVVVQADAMFRMQPEDINRWFAKNTNGEMVPFSAFASTQWAQGSPLLARFSGTAAIAINGSTTPGASTGEAMSEAERLVSELPGGYSVSWSGLSYQERLAGSQATMLYVVSLLVVFLCLAALYESWSIPLSVLLAVPVGVFGALLSALIFDQSNDVYFKVGLLTTIGLTAKNAILIVEFAKDLVGTGKGAAVAVVEAARLRLRPIVMTSLAFVLGVLPLARATGAGSAAQNAIGIGVMGGMLSATLLGVFFVPFLFVTVMKLSQMASRRHRSSVMSD